MSLGAADPRDVEGALTEAYGPRPWTPTGKPLDGLIGTILSQNTSDTNSHRAFASLVHRFSAWEAVAAAPVEEIEDAIRSGGLARQKAARIRSLLQAIEHERGTLSLDFLAAMPDAEAWRYLAAFKGVGPKTAACVLLFDLGRQVFPVDTHIHRIASRLGWLPEGCSDKAAHEILGALIAPELRYSLHVHLIEHGRLVCHPHRPECSRCPLAALCRRIGVTDAR